MSKGDNVTKKLTNTTKASAVSIDKSVYQPFLTQYHSVKQKYVLWKSDQLNIFGMVNFFKWLTTIFTQCSKEIQFMNDAFKSSTSKRNKIWNMGPSQWCWAKGRKQGGGGGVKGTKIGSAFLLPNQIWLCSDSHQ